MKLRKMIILGLVLFSLGLSNISFAQEGSSYLLGPEDVIRIVVWDNPEISGEFKVDPAGNITMTILGEIRVEGLTTTELEKILYEKLGKYIEDPKITIIILGYFSKKVYILGQVIQPGKYSIGGEHITIREAVLKAGLPTKDADLKRVKVITPGKPQPVTKIINLYKILYKGEMEKDVRLDSEDVVYVPMALIPRITDTLGRISSPFIQYLSLENLLGSVFGNGSTKSTK
ncbi:polysaccharide export protein [Candidatus Desantisbacteria bacterium]|nr:polysaccharide export protein [Candidatus Desantisbacteria bacterium]